MTTKNDSSDPPKVKWTAVGGVEMILDQPSDELAARLAEFFMVLGEKWPDEVCEVCTQLAETHPLFQGKEFSDQLAWQVRLRVKDLNSPDEIPPTLLRWYLRYTACSHERVPARRPNLQKLDKIKVNWLMEKNGLSHAAAIRKVAQDRKVGPKVVETNLYRKKPSKSKT